MFIFMKKYLLNYIFIKSYDLINVYSHLMIIWSLKAIIYLILRIIYVSSNNLFFEEYTKESIFTFLLTTTHNIHDTIFINIALNLTSKRISKLIFHLL